MKNCVQNLKRLRVGVDGRFITRQPRRGIGNYSLNLINELVRLDSEINFVIYIAEKDIENILPQLPNVRIRQLWPSIYPLWENIALPIAARQDELDILHCLGNTAPFIMPSSVKLVLSIMDVMFLQKGDFVPKPTNRYQVLGRLYRIYSVPNAARHAKKIITISDFSRRDITQLIEGVSEKKVSVTHLSCDSIFYQDKAILNNKKSSIADILNGPYIFCLGAEDPRKNTLGFVQAYLKLLKNGLISENLVISGYSNWEKSESFQVVRTAGAEHKVKFLKFISIEELSYLYKNASVFAYPSLYEGFGIPILEAFSSGCPVMASNVTSIPEVGGDAALYFDPLSISAMESALLQLVRNSGLRQDLIARGYERAKLFTWAETASKTMAVYWQCMGESRL
jgi:glycosyltransferase involved in cell wall biosynthesis